MPLKNSRRARSTKFFVVSGVSPEDRFYADQARAQFQEFEGRLDFTYSSGLAMPDVLRHVAELPPHTIVYFLTFFEDTDGSRFVVNSLVGQGGAPGFQVVLNWPALLAAK